MIIFYYLEAANHSPVKAASLIFKSWLSIILPSADTLSPGLRITISPGTKFSDKISFSCPFLITIDLILKTFFNSLKALEDLLSCIYPIIVFKTTATEITIKSVYSLRSKVTIPANSNI